MKIKNVIKSIGVAKIPLIWIVLVIIMSLTNEYFLTASNAVGLLRSIASYGVLSIGLSFILITGNLDVSLGSVLALCTVCFATAIPLGFIPATIITMVFGGILGGFTGFFVAYLKLNAFVVTMCMQMTYKGIALYLTNSTTIRFSDPGLTAFSELKLWGIIPISIVVLVVVVIVCGIILKMTAFGRNVYLLGGNKKAAEFLGIPVANHIWKCFIIAGICSGLAAMLYCSRVYSASANFAGDAAMAIIPIAIIGGTTLKGGVGGAVATFTGALLMYTIYNAMTMFNIYLYLQDFIKGLILLVIVVGSKYAENRKLKV